MEKIKVKVGEEEKEFSGEDIQELLGQVDSLQNSASQAKPVLELASKYGVDVQTLLRQSEGSLALVSKLLDEGVINERGEVMMKAEPSKDSEDPSKKTSPLPWEKSDGEDSSVGTEKVMEVVGKALKPMLSKLEERLGLLENDLGQMTEQNLRTTLKSKHPELSDREVKLLFQTAINDRKKNLWEHAEDFVAEKKAELDGLRKEHAKDFGINLEEFDQNKLNQQSGEKGPAAVVQGKRISFKGGEDAVSPMKATQEYFRHLRSEE